MNLDILSRELKNKELPSFLRFSTQGMLDDYNGKKGFEGMFKKFTDFGNQKTPVLKEVKIKVLKYKANYNKPKPSQLKTYQ